MPGRYFKILINSDIYPFPSIYTPRAHRKQGPFTLGLYVGPPYFCPVSQRLFSISLAPYTYAHVYSIKVAARRRERTYHMRARRTVNTCYTTHLHTWTYFTLLYCALIYIPSRETWKIWWNKCICYIDRSTDFNTSFVALMCKTFSNWFFSRSIWCNYLQVETNGY